MNVNISNEFNFAEVHDGMNCSRSLAKYMSPRKGAHVNFASNPL